MLATVKVLRLPGLPIKGDISDWIAAGGTREQFEHLVADADLWTPTATANGQSSTTPTTYMAVQPGTRVKALDQGNFGTVVSDHGTTCMVHFDGAEGSADVDLPKEKLQLLNGTRLANVNESFPEPMTLGELLDTAI